MDMDKAKERSRIDLDALNDPQVQQIKSIQPPTDIPFDIGKLGHVVLMVQDIDRSVQFYTQVLGFKISDVYPESMRKGGMVFLRFNKDHHGIGLVGQGEEPSKHRELHHMAFEVSTIDEVFRARDHLEKLGVEIDFEGRRRSGCQVAVEFFDPDGHSLEIYWGIDQIEWDEDARPGTEWLPIQPLEDAVDQTPPGQDTTLADPALRRG